MSTLYKFIINICKERDIKTEELQKRLGFSRSTLYRYMKGINQITPKLEKDFIKILHMDETEVAEFAKFVRLSAFEQSLIDSRYVLDEFLFEKAENKADLDMDIVFYNNDRFLRTLSEIFNLILECREKDELEGSIKIVDCLKDDIFVQIESFLQHIFTDGLNIEAEHFINFSGNDYRQNIFSFVNIFPLIKHDKYKLYFREKDRDVTLLNDSMLISLSYVEDGIRRHNYFAISFFEHSMPECITFTDEFMYSYLSKAYSNLKHNFSSVIQTFDEFDFGEDVLMELTNKGGYYIIKPNPCHDKIPFEVFKSIKERMSDQEMVKFISALSGQELSAEALPIAVKKALQYMKKRLEFTFLHKQIDVYSKNGMLDFVETGKVSDHLEYLPALNKEELKMTLSYLSDRNNNPKDDYTLYITEKDFVRDELVIFVIMNYCVVIEYVLPRREEGLWKLLVIPSKRLASIFCDYIENHIPVSYAMNKDKTDTFMKELMEKL